MSIAIAVAVLAWTGDASVARAGCGDDLMPLHTGASAGDSAAQGSEPSTVTDLLVNRLPSRPCDGPSCGETPPDQPGLAAVPQPHRSGIGSMALSGTGWSAMPPMIIERRVAESKATPRFVPADVFRPPSALPLR